VRDVVPLGRVIGQRKLTFSRNDGESEPVLVAFGEPVELPDGAWACPYLIKGGSFERQYRAIGSDSAQALLLVQYMIRTELDRFEDTLSGSFLYDGQRETFFPRMPPEHRKDA